LELEVFRVYGKFISQDYQRPQASRLRLAADGQV